LHKRNINVSVLRFTGIYGSGRYSLKTEKRAIPNFIRLAKKGESPVIYGNYAERRDYLSIDDAVDAILKTIQRPFDGIVNIGSGKSINIKELADLICKLTASKASPKIKENRIKAHKKPLDYLLDIRAAKKIIGFDPRVDIEEGLRKVIKNEI
jgi:nucleoside-diphosphate-sugar epimerase